jgi:hypothetical protein
MFFYCSHISLKYKNPYQTDRGFNG